MSAELAARLSVVTQQRDLAATQLLDMQVELSLSKQREATLAEELAALKKKIEPVGGAKAP